MRIAFYHPNMHVMGGGETVCLTLASELRKKHQITIFTTYPVDIARFAHFFGLALDGITFKPFRTWIMRLPTFETLKPSLHAHAFLREMRRNKSFDLVIDTCSNGLFDRKLPMKTICFVHFPNHPKPKRGWKAILNPFMIKTAQMFHYDAIVCNSAFTKREIAKLTDRPLSIVYPPVETGSIKPGLKKNIIATVGRFSPEKKHEIMIDAFIRLENALPEYSLHIIGAYHSSSDHAYLEMLKMRAKGHRVEFHLNMDHRDVLQFLSSARIYWHARGYGESGPAEYENFGITTAEAMAAGCIPIVINLGAQPEIVTHGKTGYCWDTPDQLVDYTKKAVRSRDVEGIRAIRESKRFDTLQFIRKMRKLI